MPRQRESAIDFSLMSRSPVGEIMDAPAISAWALHPGS
jgi:hypothetical protein